MKTGCDGQNAVKKRSIELPVLGNSTSQKAEVRVSQTARWRAAALIVLNLLMVAHVVQWWIMGRTISPIEPSESMYTLQNGALNAGFIFFFLAILATLIFGRFVCGWGCHILALQDLCAWLLKKMGLTPRPFRSRLLVFVPLIAALYMFVWPTVLRAIVRVANCIPSYCGSTDRADHSAVYQPPDHDRILGDIPAVLGRGSISLHLRFYDRLLSWIEGVLHLRLSVRRIFQPGR